MMIPLRRSLIVKEHGNLPYPEGTACASVLIAGEKGGEHGRAPPTRAWASRSCYALLQQVFQVIAETPGYVTARPAACSRRPPSTRASRPSTWASATSSARASPACWSPAACWPGSGSSRCSPRWCRRDRIAAQLVKLGYLADLATRAGPYGWDPATHSFAQLDHRHLLRLRAPDRRRRGGGGRLHHAAQDAAHHRRQLQGEPRRRCGGARARRRRARTERDLPLTVVLVGSLALVLVMAVLPVRARQPSSAQLLLGVLIVVFGFFFVTVASRIVGLIGTSRRTRSRA